MQALSPSSSNDYATGCVCNEDHFARGGWTTCSLGPVVVIGLESSCQAWSVYAGSTPQSKSIAKEAAARPQRQSFSLSAWVSVRAA